MTTDTHQRIDSLDFLRAIAVLGILIINIENFALPWSFNPYAFGFESQLDKDVRFWVYYLAQGKFFAIFSLLFGVSFYLMLERLSTRYSGMESTDIFARRLLGLFAIGVAHSYLLWDGDILHHYAICGLLLFVFRGLSPNSQKVAALVLLGIILINAFISTNNNRQSQQAYVEAIAVAEDQRSEAQRNAINRWQRKTSERNSSRFDDKIEARQGSYWDNVAQNASSFKLHRGDIFFDSIVYKTLLMMLLGILLYRAGIFHNIKHTRYYWPASLSLFTVAMTLGYFRYYQWSYDYLEPVTHLALGLAFELTPYLQGLAYLLVLNGIYQRFLANFKLTPLMRVGKMALTNYLLHSVICALIFFGYGLGLYNQLSRSELLGIVGAIWLLNLLLSYFWLQHYQQGPMEALWRRMTYGNQRLHSQLVGQTRIETPVS